MLCSKEVRMEMLDARHIDGSKPGVVARDGKAIGCFLPFSAHSLPRILRKHIAYCLSDSVASNMKARGLTEEDILESLK